MQDRLNRVRDTHHGEWVHAYSAKDQWWFLSSIWLFLRLEFPNAWDQYHTMLHRCYNSLGQLHQQHSKALLASRLRTLISLILVVLDGSFLMKPTMRNETTTTISTPNLHLNYKFIKAKSELNFSRNIFERIHAYVCLLYVFLPILSLMNWSLDVPALRIELQKITAVCATDFLESTAVWICLMYNGSVLSRCLSAVKLISRCVLPSKMSIRIFIYSPFWESIGSAWIN